MKIGNLLYLQLKIKMRQLRERCIHLLPFGKEKKQLFSVENKFVIQNLTSKIQKKTLAFFFGKYLSAIVFKTKNGILTSSLNDVEINGKLGSQGQYDLDAIKFLSSLVNQKSTIYFLGAHIGCLLIPLSKYVNRVIGFEANPETFAFLQNNILINRVHNAQIFNFAVYDDQTTLTFYQNHANTGGSKIKPHTDRFIYTYDEPAKIKVNTIRLDYFITTQKLPYPNLLVVDVEGAEYAALKGATECLRSCKYLYIEFVPHHLFNVAHINVRTFLSVILPFFNRMKVVDGSPLNMNNIFGDDKIHARLVDLYVRGTCVDLLFFKERKKASI